MADPQFQDGFFLKFFQYIANFAFVASATIVQTIQIDSDADFELYWLEGSRDNAAVTIEVTEGGAGGIAWSSAPVNIDNFLGTAQLPFPVGLIPQLLPKKRIYTIRAVNTSGGANNVQIAFTGYKRYPGTMQPGMSQVAA